MEPNERRRNRIIMVDASVMGLFCLAPWLLVDIYKREKAVFKGVDEGYWELRMGRWIYDNEDHGH